MITRPWLDGMNGGGVCPLPGNGASLARSAAPGSRPMSPTCGPSPEETQTHA